MYAFLSQDIKKKIMTVVEITKTEMQFFLKISRDMQKIFFEIHGQNLPPLGLGQNPVLGRSLSKI